MQKANVGGVLAIVASSLGMLGSLFLLALPAIFRASSEIGSQYDDAQLAMASVVYVVLGIFGLVMGVLGIVGGIFAIRRKVFGLALTGAIVSSIIFYPLGIVAVILISMGYLEFRKPEPVVAVPVMPPPPMA